MRDDYLNKQNIQHRKLSKNAPWLFSMEPFVRLLDGMLDLSEPALNKKVRKISSRRGQKATYILIDGGLILPS